jgi:hypothetical protein
LAFPVIPDIRGLFQALKKNKTASAGKKKLLPARPFSTGPHQDGQNVPVVALSP